MDLIIFYFVGKKVFFEKFDKWLDNMYVCCMENEVLLFEVIIIFDKLCCEFVFVVGDFCIYNDEVFKCDFLLSLFMVNYGFDWINEVFFVMYYNDIVKYLE